MKFKAILFSVFLSMSVSNSKVQAADQNKLSNEQIAQLVEIARECIDNDLLHLVALEDSAENFWQEIFIVATSVAVAGVALAIGVNGGSIGSEQDGNIQN